MAKALDFLNFKISIQFGHICDCVNVKAWFIFSRTSLCHLQR
jgi:hypothetical protein